MRDGFYSAVQYERLTPSVNQVPPVLGGASSSSSSSYSNQTTSSSSGVQYERLAPSSTRHPSPQYDRLSSSSSAQLQSPPLQYERLTPGTSSSSVHLPSPQYDRSTPTASPAGGATLVGGAHRSSMPFHRQNSPLQYESGGAGGVSPSLAIPPLSSARSASFPGPTLPSPPVLCSPVDLSAQRVDTLRRERKPSRPLPPVAENSPTDVPMDGTPSSDKSTPFSMVMEEWMSQLRTPTPDVMLLPSPYDFNKNTPTPVEKLDDIRHIHDALLPTPPQIAGVVADQRQGTKTNDYVSSSASNPHRPLVDDIASLCRDLISQEVSEQLAKRLLKMGAFQELSQKIGQEKLSAMVAGAAAGQRAEDDDDNDQGNDTSSVAGGSVGSKGKRRKMCTTEGCQNLSRSRGLCKAHGGGRRCSVEGCSRASQSGSLCITHGGGKRCTIEGCQKAAQSRGMCKAHGGGVRCRVAGCTKSSQGDGFCRTHGGGRRCGYEGGCTKWAQRNGMCMAHSEGRYGNSYRGRVARNPRGDTEQQIAAQALLGAANAPVY